MRDSLTVLAILLIGVLTVALVGPHLVDWSGHRALIERRLSDAAGTPVTVTGPIDLKLLPKPVLRLGGVAVGEGAGGRPRLTARSLEAELSLAALMRGQVQFVDATLVGPKLDLVQARDGGFGFDLPSEAAADRVAFDHIGVRDGAVDLALADGRHLEVREIDLDGEATTLRGPFKAAGSVGAVPFRLATGTPDAGRLRVKLHLDGAGARPSLDLDGIAAARPGAAGPGFNGTATAAGQVALDGTPAAVPWRATAKLSADRDGAKASDVEVRAGADLRALIASGDGSGAWPAGSAPPRAALRLRGASLDADSLAVPPPNSDIAPPGSLDVLKLLLRSLSEDRGGLPLRLDVDAGFDTATLDGRTALGTAATVRLGPEPGAGLTLSVEGPGGARLALDGRVDAGPPPPVAGPFGAAPSAPEAAFHGRAELGAADLRRAAAWLRPAAPDLIDRIAAMVPGRSLRAAGTVAASADGIAARDLDIRLGGTAVSGTLSLARAAGSGNARLSADLSADALDLDGLPDLATAGTGASGLDLDLSLSARAVRLASSAVGALAAGRVALRVTRTGEDVRLEKLALDLGGARLDASGSRDAAGGRGSLHVEAAAAGPLAETLAPVLPAPAAAALRARAALLSPLDVTATLEAAAGDDGALVPERLALAGRAGDVTLDGALTPEGSAAGRAAADRPLSLSLQLAAPRGADLLRLLGLPPGSVAGAARLSASARGTVAGGLTGRVEATLGTASAAFAGRAGTAGGEGRLTLHAADIRPVLASAGLTAPDADLAAEAEGDLAWDAGSARWTGLSARVGGSKVAGELSLDLAQRRGPGGEPLPVLHGRLALDRLPAQALLGLALGSAPSQGAPWSPTPFAAPPALPRGEAALTVGDMPIGGALDGHAVSLTLRTAPDGVTLADLAGGVAEGRVAGTLSIRRDGPGATLSGRLAWRDVAVDGGGLAARTSGSEEVAAVGDSPAALVGSLAGTGTVTLSGELPRTDPTAPARVLAAVTARDALAERGSSAPEPTSPDGDALRRDLAAALDAGPLPVEAAAVPAVLAGGVLSPAPLRRTGSVALPRPGQGGTVAADWTAETSLSLDLRRLTLASRVDLGAPSGVVATVTRAGPVGGSASRVLDIGGLVAAVQAGAVARAQDRIDVLEQDIRERAAFNRQLKAIEQRRQTEREQAEAAARAEAARVADEARARAAAAEARRQAAEQQKADAARQKAEDARVQAQIEAAARAEAARERAERGEVETLRPGGRSLKPEDAPLDLGGSPSDGPRPPSAHGPRVKGRDPFDLPPPPSIVRERDGAQ